VLLEKVRKQVKPKLIFWKQIKPYNMYICMDVHVPK